MIIRSTPLRAGRLNSLESICTRCLRSLSQSAPSAAKRRTFTNRQSRNNATAAGIVPQRLRVGYFLDNAFLDASRAIGKRSGISTAADGSVRSGTSGTSKTADEVASEPAAAIPQDLPHRRRQKAKQDIANQSNQSNPRELPPDASSTLTTLSTSLPLNSLRRTLSTLLALTKPRLSFLIVLTTTSAYSIYPVPALLSPTITDTPSLSALTLLFLTVGTSLTCASANTLNMLYEPKWDALMSRTKNRPLVRGLISPRGAAIFAIASGLGGVLALYYGVNPTVAFLGGFNIFLYAGVYTPLKRISVINTWAGALVGGIPPLMGWAAAAGQTATGDGTWRDLLLNEQSIGGWLLASLLVAWQFPHFMALSWPIRFEYRDAGYKMLAWTNPNRNGRVALRYSLALFPICVALCYTGVTEWSFAVASAPVNIWMVKESYRFWKLEGQKGSARGLFWASIWHLPVVMVLAMAEKKGLWARVWKSIVGEPDLEDGEEWMDEEEEEDIGRAVGEVVRPATLSASSR